MQRKDGKPEPTGMQKEPETESRPALATPFKIRSNNTHLEPTTEQATKSTVRSTEDAVKLAAKE